MRKLMFAVVGSALLLGCQNNNQVGSSPGPIAKLFGAQADVISVRSLTGAPVAGAKVLIGESAGNPFPDNVVSTDVDGNAALPSGWTAELPVTVDAPGFVKVTYLQQAPHALDFKLTALKAIDSIEVKGKVLGLPVVNNDDKIDFGLVIPAFTKIGMLTFNIDSVISPIMDTISVIGQSIDLPANTSLPKQSEKYSLFTATFDKATYRLYLDQPGISRLYAARGRFPFHDVVDEMRNNAEFYELINYFTITGGVIRDQNLVAGSNAVDLTATELNYTQKVNLKAPAIKADEMFLTVAVAENSGYFVPTDLKKLKSNEAVSLSVMTGGNAKILAAIKRTAEMKNKNDRITATVQNFTPGITPNVYELIADPTFANGILTAKTPAALAGVNSIGTMASLSQEVEVNQGGKKVKVMAPVWQVYAPGWATELRMPALTSKVVASKQKWEINYLGSLDKTEAAIGPQMLEATTHVTHSSTTF